MKTLNHDMKKSLRLDLKKKVSQQSVLANNKSSSNESRTDERLSGKDSLNWSNYYDFLLSNKQDKQD